MTWTLTVSDSTDANDAEAGAAIETQIETAARTFVESLPSNAGTTDATGQFEFNGSVDLLPAPPVDHKAELEAARAELDNQLAALPAPGEDGSTVLTADERSALLKAAEQYDQAVTAFEAEAVIPSPTDTAAPADAQAADVQHVDAAGAPVAL